LLLVWMALVLGKHRPIDRAWIVFVLAIVAANSLYWFAGGPDFELFGWASGSLLLVWTALVLGKHRPIDRAWIVFVLAIVAANSLYWFAGGPDFGARYWYLAIVPLIALAVTGLNALAESEEERTRLLIAVFALSLGNMALFMPWRAVDKYVGYRGMVAGVRDLAREKNFGRSLVLI